MTYFGLGDARQGIVHIIGPEQGFTLPGTTVVCGDSHTSTHGAFGALAFGIGTSEVEHVLATQTLITKRSKNMRIQVDGDLLPGVSSKDVILHTIGVIGTAGGTGAVIEYCGSAIQGLSMEARMSICNMSIEAGARAGMIAPDDITFEYLKGRPLAPKAGSAEWKKAVAYWSSLRSDPGATYDIEVFIDAKDIVPTVTWGTSPQDVVPITGIVPDPDDFADEAKRKGARQALAYMGLAPGTPMQEILLDKVFIGSCTNARIEDLRSAASVVEGRKVAPNIKRAMVVPGSGLVKKQAEAEGLDRIFVDAGFEWREAGCSMCLGMNPDILAPRERCASTSNRNFEGRQGAGGRTHLMSPAMAAAAAIAGRLADVRKLTISAKFSSRKRTSSPAPAVDVAPEVEDVYDDEGRDQVFDIPQDALPSQDETGAATATMAAATAAPSHTALPKFTRLRGIAAPLDRANVDTDAIIPKQFLKTIKRTGLGKALFYALRYDTDAAGVPPSHLPPERADFVLNRAPFRRARILVVTGPNFGCGSSREHAPWALLDFGIVCVVAPSFADIFFNNMFKNGMLPVAVPDAAALARIAAIAAAGRELEVDLERQTIRVAPDTTAGAGAGAASGATDDGDDDAGRGGREGELLAEFEVEPFRKHCLLNGLDDIGLTMQLEEHIRRFEQQRSRDTPWLDGSGYLRRSSTPPPQQQQQAADGGAAGVGATKIEAAPLPRTNRGEISAEPLDW